YVAMRLRGVVEGAVERGMIGDIHHFAAHVVALVPETRRFLRDAFGIDIEQGHPGAVLRQRFAETEAQSAGAAGDDDTITLDLEQIRDLHRAPPVSLPKRDSGAAQEAIAFRRVRASDAIVRAVKFAREGTRANLFVASFDRAPENGLRKPRMRHGRG